MDTKSNYTVRLHGAFVALRCNSFRLALQFSTFNRARQIERERNILKNYNKIITLIIIWQRCSNGTCCGICVTILRNIARSLKFKNCRFSWLNHLASTAIKTPPHFKVALTFFTTHVYRPASSPHFVSLTAKPLNENLFGDPKIQYPSPETALKFALISELRPEGRSTPNERVEFAKLIRQISRKTRGPERGTGGVVEQK